MDDIDENERETCVEPEAKMSKTEFENSPEYEQNNSAFPELLVRTPSPMQSRQFDFDDMTEVHFTISTPPRSSKSGGPRSRKSPSFAKDWIRKPHKSSNNPLFRSSRTPSPFR